MKRLKVGLDCDQCICDFMGVYLKRFGKPKESHEISKNCWTVLREDKDFWLNLPIIFSPNFIPQLYCTSRVIPKSWTKKYLKLHNLPISPIYQRFGYGMSKAPLIKGRVDVFIDDSPFNCMDLNSKGIPCLLLNTEYNQLFSTPLRIHSLNYDEIEYTYFQIFNK